MAKNVPKIADISFLQFLGPLEASKLYKTFLSCRGSSKLRFGGPHVKICQELASGMNIFPLQVKMR